MSERRGTEGAGDASRRQRAGRQQRRLAIRRRHQAQHLVRLAHEAAHRRVRHPGRPLVYLLALLFIGGSLVSAGIILALPPDVSRNQMSFLLASGCAVWGGIGLIVVIARRKAPERQAGLVAYDAVRQGLLIAGCLELNLATRVLGLWTPLIGLLLVAVFVLFEVVTLGRRPV